MRHGPESHLREAIRLSAESIDAGGGPFGAVVVHEGEVVGWGQNRVVGGQDPTAHAEVMAIRDACRTLGTHDLSGCHIYASCEPCPMCLGAIYWARISGITYAATREDAAQAGFDDSFFYEEVQRRVDERSIPSQQLLAKEARRVLEEWTRREEKTPY